MLKKLCETKLEFKQVPLLTLLVIPIAFVSSFLGGTGHAPAIFYVPYSVVFGPLAVLAFLLGTRLSGWSFFFAIAGPYPLYLLYGYVFAYLSSRSSTACQWFIGAIIALHVVSAVIFFHLANFAVI